MTEKKCQSGKVTCRSDKLKKDLISRLNRIDGQVKGITRMVEQDTYCDDILNQISSVQAAVAGVTRLLLESHIQSCVTERIRQGDQEIVDELMGTIGKLIR